MESTDIDESKLSFNPRFNSEIVNAVSDNIVYDLNIGAVNVITNEFSGQNATSTKYDFEILCNETSYYPNKFIESCRFQVKITSNTYPQPAQYYAGSAYATTAPAAVLGNSGWFSIGGLGNPIKWLPGVMGFKAMPINRAKLSCSVNMGNNDHAYTINEGVLDIHLRSVPYDHLALQMSGLSPFRVDESKYYADLGTSFPFIADFVGVNSGHVHPIKIYGEQLNVTASRWKNILGSHAGGNYVKPATSTFSTTAGTVLATQSYYGYTIPSSGGNPYFSLGTTQLIETHTFNEFYEPVLHPFFSFLQSGSKLISQVNKIKISNQIQANMQNVIACALPYAGTTISAQTSSTGAPLDSTNTGSYITDNASNISVNVTATDRKLYAFQVELQKEILPASVVKIPFIEEELISKQITLSSAWNVNTSIKLVSDPINIDRIPKRAAIWIDTFDPDDAILHMSQGLGYAEIKKLTFKLGGNNSIAQSFTKQQIYAMTKKNGLHQYSYQNIAGENDYISKNSANALGANGLPIFNCATAPAVNNLLNQSAGAVGSQNWVPLEYRYKRGIGSRVLLDFSSDIPTGDSVLVPGVSVSGGINFQITVECEQEPGNTGTYARLNYCFFYDDEVDILNNKATTKKALFTESDIMKAYHILKSRGNFRVKARYLTGGGLFSNLSKAVKTYLPKATEMINKARDIHESLKPHAEKLNGMLQNSDSEHARSGQHLLKALKFV